jgi:predicted secreted Zn-dependent protease
MTARAFFFLLLVAGCAARQQQGWLRGTTSDPYRVYGRTTEAVFRQILALGPKVEGRPSAAMTRYRFEPEVKLLSVYTEEEDGSCTCRERIHRASVGLTLTARYPEWAMYGQATKRCQASWDVYMKDLKNHELLHVTLAYDLRKEWESQLVGLAAQGSGKTCPQACSAARRELIFAVARTHEAYATSHMLLQRLLDDKDEIFLIDCSDRVGRKMGLKGGTKEHRNDPFYVNEGI